MTQKNLPQITKHFQAFIFWTIFANFRKLFWLWHNYQLTTNIWTQLRLPLMIKNRFSGAKITYKNPLFSIYPKNAKNSYLGPLVGVSILVHFSLSLSFKNSICGLLKSFSWFFEVQSAAAAAAGQAQLRESRSALLEVGWRVGLEEEEARIAAQSAYVHSSTAEQQCRPTRVTLPLVNSTYALCTMSPKSQKS